MEDTTNQPQKADASLYNGQPNDTVLSCPSAGLTFHTLSISDNLRSGVSVENVPLGNEQWFVLRVSYGHIDKVTTSVEAKGMECYVPMQYKGIKKQGNKRIITTPLLPSFISVHTTAEQVDSFLRNKSIKSLENRTLLSYYYNHTSHCEDAPRKKPPPVISDAAMYNFIRLTSIQNSHIIHVASENIKYKLGDEVVIIDREFKNIRGKVARIAEQQRVLVELFDGYLVATPYIPTSALSFSKI